MNTSTDRFSSISFQISIIAERIQTFGSKGRSDQERSATSAAISNDLFKLEQKGADPETCAKLYALIPVASECSANLSKIEGMVIFTAARA